MSLLSIFKIAFYCLLLINSVLLTNYASYNDFVPYHEKTQENFISVSMPQKIQYKTFTSISIDGNGDFQSQATSNLWTGNGSISEPYIIDKVNVTGISGTENLITIQNTDCYFIINNSIVSGGLNGINFYSVLHGSVQNSTIFNNTQDGIYIWNTNDTLIFNNTLHSNLYRGFEIRSSEFNMINNNSVYDNGNGIGTYESANFNTFSYNIVFQNNLGFSFYNGQKFNNTYYGNIVHNNNYGFYLATFGTSVSVRENSFKNNYVYNNTNGFFLDEPADNNTILSNTIIDNINYGVWLNGGDNNIIKNNNISNNQFGIFLNSDSINNSIILNLIKSNKDCGINFQLNGANTTNNIISSNLFSYNSKYALYLPNYINLTTITKNGFINNPVADYGYNNYFNKNYFSDWSIPDSNYDLIVDMPYRIAGSANNSDNNPLVLFTTDHLPIIINNNQDFLNYKSIEHWEGNGSSANPFIIQNYKFDNAKMNQIIIKNTNLYFLIRNVIVENATSDGFIIENVSNGFILNSFIFNNGKNGINLYNSSNIGISQATFFNNSLKGVYIDSSSIITVNSSVALNNTEGIYVHSGSNNNISKNNIFNNTNGIVLIEANNNKIDFNTISENNFGIIFSLTSNFTKVYNNQFQNNTIGIHISDGKIPSINNTIVNNNFVSNTKFGIDLTSNSKFTEVIKNTFIDNNFGNTQVQNNGNTNIFGYNYWNDWIGPDINNDSIVDNPYPINTSINSYDFYPLASISFTPIIELLGIQNQSTLKSGSIISVQIFDFLLTNVSYKWDNLGGISYSITNNSLILQIKIPLSEGEHTLYIFAYNNNATIKLTRFSFISDGTPPSIFLNSPANNSVVYSGISINITFFGSNGYYIYHWNLDENTTVPLNKLPLLPNGTGLHTLFIFVQDPVGNWNTTYFIFNGTFKTFITLLSMNEYIIEAGDYSNNITWLITSKSYGNYSIEMNGSSVLNHSWSLSQTLIYNITFVKIGLYNYTLTVSDSNNFTLLSTVWINVTDTVSPYIVGPFSFSFQAGSLGNDLTWQVYDASQGNYSIFQDGNLITNQTWHGEPLISTNLDYLTLGIYNFTLLIQDTSQNFAIDFVQVIVNHQAITSSSGIVSSGTNQLIDPLFILGGVAGLAVITIGGLILFGRKK